MAQSKEKLFSPEDFDKNKPSENTIGWKKPLRGLALVAVLGGIAYGAYSLFGNGNELEIGERHVVTITSDSSQSSEKTPVDGEDSDDGQAAKQEGVESQQEKPQQEMKQSVINEGDEQHRHEVPATNSEKRSNESISGTLEEKAKRVIRGDFGNGQVRKERLGDTYEEIQEKVNEMYRNGDLKL